MTNLLEGYSAGHVPGVLAPGLVHYDLPGPGLVDVLLEDPGDHQQCALLVKLDPGGAHPVKLPDH